MKKILLFLAASFSVLAANSQVIFSEDFDGIPGPTAGGAGTYVFPSGWLLRNVDNRTPDAQVAYVNEAWERREDFGLNVGDSAAFSTSYYSPLGAADDWMWTPPITIPSANTYLKWNARVSDPSYPDGYEVRVMAQPNIPTGGTGVLGNQVSSSTVVFSTMAETNAWTAHTVSLGAYAGQTVRIAFRNNSNDKFLLLIDDVVVEVTTNHNLYVVGGSVGHGEYTAAPAAQLTTAQNFQLKGSVYNYGVQACTNVRLGCDVSVNGSFLTSIQSAPVASAASGSTTNFTIPYTPTITGSYGFKFYPVMNETDEQTSNDTVVDPIGIVVDPTMMTRHYGPATGQLGIGITAGQTGYLGQTFRFETAVNIEAIEAYMTRGYATRNLRAVIYATNGSGVPTTQIAATDTLVYPDDSARLYTMPIYGGTITLPAGEYAFLQVEMDSTLALGLTNSIYTPNSGYVAWPAYPNFPTVESFGPQYQRAFMIYPKFDMCVGETGGTLATATQASCGLNDGTAVLTLDPGYSVFWSDSTTLATHNALPAGWHTFTISNPYCSFTDSVEITNPNAPTAIVDSIENALCFGGDGTITLDIQGDASPYDVIWSDGSMNETFTGPAGTYSVTITDTNNCSVTVSNATIAEPTEITAAVMVMNATCFGGDGTITLTIQGGVSPYTATWPDNSTGETFTGPAGTYPVTIVDDSGCQITVTDAEILEPTELTSTISGTDETCVSCEDGTATVAPVGGTPPYFVEWSNGTVGGAMTITDLPPGTYSASITDANGCMFTTGNVTISEFIGIEELNNYGIVVFPNPVSDYLTITAKKNDVQSATLIDASGKIIAELAKTNDSFTADMRTLAKGTYQVVIRMQAQTIVTAVAKQ